MKVYRVGQAYSPALFHRNSFVTFGKLVTDPQVQLQNYTDKFERHLGFLRDTKQPTSKQWENERNKLDENERRTYRELMAGKFSIQQHPLTSMRLGFFYARLMLLMEVIKPIPHIERFPGQSIGQYLGLTDKLMSHRIAYLKFQNDLHHRKPDSEEIDPTIDRSGIHGEIQWIERAQKKIKLLTTHIGQSKTLAKKANSARVVWKILDIKMQDRGRVTGKDGSDLFRNWATGLEPKPESVIFFVPPHRGKQSDAKTILN